MSAQDRYSHLRRAFGEDGFKVISSSKILCVGAGGIGCELIKNLVLSGFQDLEIIDLDTIDVSNLNRQFLFRGKHVGMSKSQVACEAAREFNPDVKIKSHLGNIKAEEYGLPYFQKFDLVLNALDNINARQHVNRLCLSADIPLIDSGTTGYLGQTAVIKKGETRCYDCVLRTENKKTFPICTIRNTPDKPVHCIVWAKELYKLMFGNMDESMLSGTGAEDEVDESGATSNLTEEEKRDNEELKQKEKELRSSIMEAVKRPEGSEMDNKEILAAYAKRVFEAVFDNEIKLKLKLRNGYKGAKKKPSPLSYDEALSDDSTTASASTTLRDQRVLSLRECAEIFTDCVYKMYQPDRRSSIGDASFDKDDDLSLEFVTAASNLRSHVFSIERKSKFDVKGIAGNIIHAIATTNAIVAGLQVMEAIKLLCKLKKKELPFLSPATEGDKLTKDSRGVWVAREPLGKGFLLQAETLGGPNPNCYACGTSILNLSLDTEKMMLGELIDKILRKRIGVNTPSIFLDSSELYAEGDGLDPDEVEFFKTNLPKILIKCPAGGIKNGTILDVEDFSQNLKFKLNIHHQVFDEKENPDQYELSGDAPITKPENEQGSSSSSSSSSAKKLDEDGGVKEVVADVEDVDVMIIEEPKKKNAQQPSTTSKKREGDAIGEERNGKKQCK